MRQILTVIFLTFTLGCIPQAQVPDNRTSPVPSPPVLLTVQPESLTVIDLEGNPVPDQQVRIDTVTIDEITANALASRSSGIFRWTGQVPPDSRFECLVGVGDAPIDLFNVMGIIPPITSYGHIEGKPPEGMVLRLTADGEQIFENSIARENFSAWSEVSVDLTDYAGEQVELTFEADGIIIGTKLPYWGNPEIIPSGEN